MNFFFIRAELIPMPIHKEEMKVPRGAAWYENLMALTNRFFGEQVLLAAGMSDKWPENNENVPVLLLGDEEVALYQSAFLVFVGVMGVRPPRDGEEYCLEQIRPNFMPCGDVTPAGKEVVYLSSEESVASSDHELNLPHDMFAGVFCNLGVDPEEKKPKRVLKKKITVVGGTVVKKMEVTSTTSDVASRKGGKPQCSMASCTRSSLGSAGSKGPESGATHTSIKVEETKVDPDPEEMIRKNASKRSRAEINLRTLYTEVSPKEVIKKPAVRPKINVIPPKAVPGEKDVETSKAGKQPIDITPEVEKTPEVVKRWLKNPRAAGRPHSDRKITSTVGESAGDVHEESLVETLNVKGESAGGFGVGGRKDSPPNTRTREPSPIHPEETLGDIYYKSYDESRADEIHAPVWKVRQVRHQRDHGHDVLCRSHVFTQANCTSISHQITCELCTMYLERSSWVKHRERLAAEAKLFEQAKAQLAKENEPFEQEKRSEEWGLQALKNKLQASEDTLAEERRKWRVACDRDNKQMFAAHTEITNLKARVEELKKSEPDYKDKYEEAKSHRERVELSQQIISKYKDLADKDVEIAELQGHLREVHETLEAERRKSDSLEINLAAEKVKAETMEEAHKVRQVALNVAQENDVEVQSKVEPLITDLGWLQHYGVAYVANSILNATELDRAVAALTMAARAAGHRAGYVECAVHVE
ncbi:hypothetical protein Hanom_Chr02g00131791 [Helianthus anomalus]